MSFSTYTPNYFVKHYPGAPHKSPRWIRIRNDTTGFKHILKSIYNTNDHVSIPVACFDELGRKITLQKLMQFENWNLSKRTFSKWDEMPLIISEYLSEVCVVPLLFPFSSNYEIIICHWSYYVFVFNAFWEFVNYCMTLLLSETNIDITFY